MKKMCSHAAAIKNHRILLYLLGRYGLLRSGDPQWWYMSVLILIMIGPVIAMAIALERFIARGLLVGAVKG